MKPHVERGVVGMLRAMLRHRRPLVHVGSGKWVRPEDVGVWGERWSAEVEPVRYVSATVLGAVRCGWLFLNPRGPDSRVGNRNHNARPIGQSAKLGPYADVVLARRLLGVGILLREFRYHELSVDERGAAEVWLDALEEGVDIEAPLWTRAMMPRVPRVATIEDVRIVESNAVMIGSNAVASSTNPVAIGRDAVAVLEAT